MKICDIYDSKWVQVELTQEFSPFRFFAKPLLFIISLLPEKYAIKIVIYLQCKFLDYVGYKYTTTKPNKNYKNVKTFGGFLEDRAKLIGFLEESCDKHMIHLGIDINNMDPGTLIKVPCDVEIIHVFIDSTKINGWGGRLIMKMKDSFDSCPYLIYGHLSITDLPTVGQVFKKGDIIGKLGDIYENGGWFPHLHVQCITQKFYDEYYDEYSDNLQEIDGYFFEKVNFEEYVCDPTRLVI